MKKIITYLKITALLALVGFLYGSAQYKNNQHKISEISVHFVEMQPKFLTANKVENLLKKTMPSLLNVPKSEIDLHTLENVLRQNDMVETAEVFISPKGKLTVEVTQRVPILRLTSGSKTYYLDRHGKEMPLSPNYSARVPLVTGVSSKEAKQEVFQLAQILQADEFYKKQIIGIHRKINGDYLLSTRIGRHKVLFGKFKNTTDKLKKLRVFYKKEWETETLKKYKLINLKYNHQVVCSK